MSWTKGMSCSEVEASSDDLDGGAPTAAGEQVVRILCPGLASARSRHRFCSVVEDRFFEHSRYFCAKGSMDHSKTARTNKGATLRVHRSYGGIEGVHTDTQTAGPRAALSAVGAQQ